jgi:hypothetical protein
VSGVTIVLLKLTEVVGNGWVKDGEKLKISLISYLQ